MHAIEFGRFQKIAGKDHIRLCRKDEPECRKRFHFIEPEDVEKYNSFMTSYYEEHYQPKGDLFFKNACLYVISKIYRPRRAFCENNTTNIQRFTGSKH